MSKERWLHNFKNSVSYEIDFSINQGYRVKGIAMTEPLKKKYEKAIGYETDNILGYKISLMDILEAPEEFGIISDPLH